MISSMDRIEIMKSIAAQSERGELTFPTNIDATLKIQQAFDDPDCSVSEVTKLLLMEPYLSARIVAVANSAAYNRTGHAITDVRSAITRLGFRSLHALATAVVARQFASMITAPELRAKATQLWEHTAHVAALAHVIARRVTHQDPETALFAAIVHEVGGFYLLSRAQAYPGLLDGEPAEWVENGEKTISQAVLKRLSVPAQVVEAVEAMWHGYLALPPETLGDTLILSNNLAPVESPLHQPRDAKAKASVANIDAVIGEETLSSILAESADEIISLTSALKM
jgi:HD-like signal output (HDOD) protein